MRCLSNRRSEAFDRQSQRGRYSAGGRATSKPPLFIAARRHDERVRRSAVGRALMVLGAISYSLYRTHQFNVRPARAVARALFPDR